MKIQTGKTLLRSIALTCAVGFATAAQAVVTRNDGTDWIGEGAFSASDNWQGGRDASSTAEARFNGQAGKIVRFDSLYSLTGYIWVGEFGSEASDYNLYISADGSTKNSVVFTANPGNGFNTTGSLAIADGLNQTGALHVFTGAYGVGGILNLAEGNYSQGYLRVEQGALTVDGAAYAARCGWDAGATSKATLEVKDGTLTINGCDTDQESAGLLVGIGENTSASIVVDNGTLSVPNGGTMLYPNGQWNNNDDSITVNVRNGGTFSTGGALTLGRYGSESITVDVSSSGTLAAKSITRGGANGTAIINLNKGTLKALDDGTFIANGQNGIDIYVGDEGGTIDTNNRSITIEAPISGEGTLTLVGGGTVTFLGTVACTIAAEDGTSYDVSGTYYWVGGAVGENSNWSNPDNWRGGEVPSSVDDYVVIPDGASITLTEDATAGTITVNGVASISGAHSVYFLNVNKGVANAVLTLGDGVVLCCAGSSDGTAVFDADMNIEAGSTVTVRHIVDRITGGSSTNRRVVKITGGLKGYGTLWLKGDWRSNVNTMCGSNLASMDNSGFHGTVKVTSNDTQNRDAHTIAASATSETCHWRILADCTNPNYAAGLFADSGTASEQKKYYFGSLALRLPANYNQSKPLAVSNIEFVIGNLDTNSSLSGSDYFNSNSGIRWVAHTATLENSIKNAAYIDVVGGGNVGFGSSDGVPRAINFKEKGGYVVLTSDDALNAAIIAAITTVDLDDDGVFGFYYDGETELTIDVSSKAPILSGKKMSKIGSGALYVTGLPNETVCDVMVNDGSLVLPHGVTVGNVMVAQGASLLIELNGAVDNEVVFTYGSLAGDVSYRNLASVGRLDVDDVANTWTYVVTGSARTFKWNGTEGASWAEPNNWLVVDGDSATTATEIPSAIDTAVIESDAAISVPATIAGNVVVSSGATLTITHGITFANSLTLDGNLAFDMTLDGVGASTPLVTVGGTGSSVSAANFIIPATYEVTGAGTFTATRVAGTYTWTGSVDNSWATSGNWKVGEMAVTEVPAQEDSVVFPANDAEGFQAWEVTLPWDVYADTLTLESDVVLSGARTLKAYVINGTAELKLNNAHLGCNGRDIAVNCPLNILPGTTDYIYLSGYNANLAGALYGSGSLISDAGNKQNVGVKFNASVSEFYGTFTSTNYNNRDATDFGSGVVGSENAVWNVSPSHSKSYTEYLIHSADTLYKFGAFNGQFWSGNYASTVEIGGREDVNSSFVLNSHTTQTGDQRPFTITKIGGATMSIGNGKDSKKIKTLYLNGGITEIKCTPTDSIQFGGGALRTPKYNAGTAEEPEEYYVDPSAVIQNSTGPIGFDSNGADFTWATAVPDTNLGGLTKYGAGTLTLAVEPLYAGLTTVMEGTLVLPTGSMFFTDSSRPVGALGNGEITGADGAALEISKYAFPAGTVLYGDEKGADEAAKLANIIPGNLDFSNVTGVDVSAKTLVAGEPFVLAFFDGSITGLNKNNIELTVPERPEGVREDKWRWAVRVMTKTYPDVEGGEPVSKSYKCVCVAPEVIPFSIHLR